MGRARLNHVLRHLLRRASSAGCVLATVVTALAGTRGDGAAPVFAAVFPCSGASECGDQAWDDRPPRPAVRPARTDRYGDPLPAGALARLGTLRLRHPHTVSCVAFSADGKLVASGGWDGSVLLWDPDTGKEVLLLGGRQDSISSLALSADGRYAASGSMDKTMCLWDLTTGQEVFRSPPHGNTVLAIAFSPDGTRLASAGAVVTLWDVATRRPLGELGSGLRALAFSPDGKRLAVGGEDSPTIHLWDVATRKEVRQFRGQGKSSNAIAFSPDGSRLLAFCNQGPARAWSLRVWQTDSGKELRHLSGRDGGWAAFAPDGKRLAIGNQRGELRLLDADTGAELRRLNAHPHEWLMAMAFSPDGRWLATGGTDHVLRLWDIATGKERRRYDEPYNGISGVVYSPDGKVLAARGGDGVLRFWDPRTGRELYRLPKLSIAAFVAGGKQFVTHRDVAPTLREAVTGKELRRFVGPKREVESVAIAPDGSRLVAASRQDGVYCWDFATARLLWHCAAKQSQQPRVVFAPDGKTLAFNPDFGAVRLLDPATGKELRQIRSPNPQGKVGPLAYSPDGSLLAMASKYDVYLVEAATGAVRAQLTGHRNYVQALRFSPDGRTLVTTGKDVTVRLWEVATGGPIHCWTGHGGRGHLGGVTTVAFAPDGRAIASAGDDATVLIWDVTGRIEDGRLLDQPIRAADLEALWSDLADADAAKAHRSLWKLAAAPGPALPMLRERLRPTAAPDPQQLRQLIRDLDDERFAVREAASAALAKSGAAARPALETALAKHPTPEARRRLQRLLSRFRVPKSAPETLRASRAVAVLEYIGSPEARQILQRLAQGVPGAAETEEAKQALSRLGHSAP